MSKLKIGVVLLVISLSSMLWSAPAHAQDGGWSEPYRLSSEDGSASEAYMVADQFGYVHAFWTETLFEDGRTVIKYARFDGITWTKPNDIFVRNAGIRNISPFVDQDGILRIVWSEGQTGLAYYAYAPATIALSAQNWAQPFRIDVPSRPVYFKVDSKGVFHILYINQTEEAGVYYIRSEDKGLTWSSPLWVDQDIPSGYMPDSLSFQLDENDGLHAAWFYGSREVRGGDPDWVRYSHSLDGGHSWSAPTTIDRHQEGSDHNLTNASPVMIVQGQTVHIVWAAGSLPYRYHSYSTDLGLTWSTPVQIFGELHGQAFDGLTVDGAGRVHFFGQIRYPLAIYHAYWDQNQWSTPLIVYFIAQEGSEESMGDRVHAHNIVPVVRAGNQVILTFGDPPSDSNRRLFVTYRTLDDIPPIETVAAPPIPTSVPISSPTVQPTPILQWTATAPSLTTEELQPLEPVPAPDFAIRVALVPILLVLGVTITVRFIQKRKD